VKAAREALDAAKSDFDAEGEDQRPTAMCRRTKALIIRREKERP